jgi:penicillin-binding protein 1B
LDKTQRKNLSPLDGAVVVTLPQSGEVVALLGGRLVGYDGFNRALDANRQIGSLAKPLAYLVALESGRYNATTILDDSDIEVKLADGSRWHPQNYEKIANGNVPVVRALAESLNLATVRMGLDVGLPKIAQAFSRLGLERVPLAVPSLLLGSVELSPYEVAQIYNCLAAGGFSTPLRAVRAVVSEDGKPLKAFPLQVRPVAAASTVYQLNRMLTQVIDHGTGRGARASLPAGLIVAGKTGTSSDYRDSWFAGFSGNHLIVVWVGTDDNRPTGLTGASGALGIWAQLMGSLSTASWNPPIPDSLQEISIDYSTGLAADRSCSADPITVAVAQGTQILRAPACGNARH